MNVIKCFLLDFIMPFRLTNALAAFQRLMERCMNDLDLRFCLIHLDDIIIFPLAFEQQPDRLDAVFSRLTEHNLYLKGSYSEFFKPKVTYLGHLVTEKGIEAISLHTALSFVSEKKTKERGKK